MYRAWDITDTTRWRHLSYTDVWGIGIPCQSTSGAGRSGGRQDDRDLFGTLVDMLRHIRPPLVVVEVVPGFWNPRTPHLRILLDEIRSLPYLLEGKELDLESYLPQKRKRGVLVLTRWDLYRMAWLRLLGQPACLSDLQLTTFCSIQRMSGSMTILGWLTRRNFRTFLRIKELPPGQLTPPSPASSIPWPGPS